MAETKASKPSIEYQQDSDGNHHIGVTVDKVFIPFASRSAVDMADRVEAGKSPEAKAAAGEPAETEGE